MKILDSFQKGDGAHCGLCDWYEDGEVQLTQTIYEHIPFDTGWYSSKKEIANARIWSEDGSKIKVEVSVSDDFDTEGLGYASTDEWTIDAVQTCITSAWDNAEKSRDENQEYEGFRVGRNGRWEETYLINIGWGENLSPSGDNYHWWGWQHDKDNEEQGLPNPNIPVEIVQSFEKWATRWAFGLTEDKSLKIGEWEITPWRDAIPKRDEPNDYVGMGWIDSRGRP